MTTRLGVICAICGDPVNVDDRSGAVEREITGWEALRRVGGANRIGDRETTGRWRHRSCVGDQTLDLFGDWGGYDE